MDAPAALAAVDPNTMIEGRRLADYREWGGGDLPPFVPLAMEAAAPTINAVCPNPDVHGHHVLAYVVRQVRHHGQSCSMDVALYQGPEAMWDAMYDSGDRCTGDASWAVTHSLFGCGCRV